MTYQETGISFPEGCRTLFLSPRDGHAPLSICFLTSSGTGTSLILLRETVDATVYLGCLVDRAGDPKGLLEIWVQNVDRMASSFRARIEAVNNSLVDRRWSERVVLFRKLNRSSLIETGWETVHPQPAFADAKGETVVYPIESVTNRPFVLCTEDAPLASAGLPAYTSSLHRYLWNGPGNESPVFVAATSDAPTHHGVKPLSEAFPDLSPLNPAGGFLLVRSLSPLRLTEFADLLAGKSWPGFSCDCGFFHLGGAYSQLGDAEMIEQRGGYLFAGRNGGASQLQELFHLKMNLILQILTETREAIRSQQLPMLNLSAESFRVRLSETGAGLPFFWTATVELVESSAGVPLLIATSESRYFIPPAVPGPSIYRPEILKVLTHGEGTLIIRKVLPPLPEGTCLEATLVTDERLEIAGSDLIHVRLALPVGRVDLYGHAEALDLVRKGETRIRTLPQKLNENVRTALEQSAGTPITTAQFETLPLLASPYDMYAAAVVAARILFVDDENTLAIAVDELLSLARQVSVGYTEGSPLSERLRATIDKDSRWRLSLGPHRLTSRPGLREIASQAVPAELWWETVGIVLRLFPGIGPDSFCRDFGDAPSLALDGIFDKPLTELRNLQLRSRSLVVSDWVQNVEIRDAIEAVRARHGIKVSAENRQ